VQCSKYTLIYNRIKSIKIHSYADILKGSIAQTQNKIKRALPNTHEKPVPAIVLPNNLDTETKTSNCTPKEFMLKLLR
jgi:hypothetical protein